MYHYLLSHTNESSMLHSLENSAFRTLSMYYFLDVGGQKKDRAKIERDQRSQICGKKYLLLKLQQRAPSILSVASQLIAYNF